MFPEYPIGDGVIGIWVFSNVYMVFSSLCAGVSTHAMNNNHKITIHAVVSLHTTA